jgi:hypothetical protein
MLWLDLRFLSLLIAGVKSKKGDGSLSRYRSAYVKFKQFHVRGATILTDDEKITVKSLIFLKWTIPYDSIVQIRLLKRCALIDYLGDYGTAEYVKIWVRKQGNLEHDLKAIGKPVYYH